MIDLTLYVAPNTCARVPTIALEEIGVSFDTQLVRVAANQQNSAEYLALNPKGKVPMLLIDGEPLTENVAILSWLAATYPDANLMPQAASPLEALKHTADLAFFAGTVHPTVTRIVMPVKFIADKALSFEIVRPVGIEAMHKIMDMINARLDDTGEDGGPWWYGDTWSAVDAYLFWVWGRLMDVGYPGDRYDNVKRHYAQSLARPAVQRAMAREVANVDILKAEGLFVPPK